MFGPEERRRAVDLYSATPMTTARVVRHLGYPTWRCLECCLAKGPRYAGRMRIPIIPLETGQKAIEPVLGGMRQRQAARRLGVETPPAMTVTWRRCAAGSRSWNRGNSLMREVVEVRGKNRAPIRGFCRTRRRRCRPTV